MSPHRIGMLSVVAHNQPITPVAEPDPRYADYGVVVRTDRGLDRVELEPHLGASRNLFLTSVPDVRGSLVAACCNSDATGRFFRYGSSLSAKVYFVRVDAIGFRTLDMDQGRVADMSDDEMWGFLNAAHSVGGLVPLMPGRMSI